VNIFFLHIFIYCHDFWISRYFSVMQTFPYFILCSICPTTSARKILSHRVKISLFVNFISNLHRLIICLKIMCFNHNLESTSVNIIKNKKVLRWRISSQWCHYHLVGIFAAALCAEWCSGAAKGGGLLVGTWMTSSTFGCKGVKIRMFIWVSLLKCLVTSLFYYT